MELRKIEYSQTQIKLKKFGELLKVSNIIEISICDQLSNLKIYCLPKIMFAIKGLLTLKLYGIGCLIFQVHQWTCIRIIWNWMAQKFFNPKWILEKLECLFDVSSINVII